MVYVDETGYEIGGCMMARITLQSTLEKSASTLTGNEKCSYHSVTYISRCAYVHLFALEAVSKMIKMK